jgi:hypothetical protein
MQRYIQSYFNQQNEIKNNPKYDDDFKEYLLRGSYRVTDNIELLNQAFIVANENKLQKELPMNSEVKKQTKKL